MMNDEWWMVDGGVGGRIAGGWVRGQVMIVMFWGGWGTQNGRFWETAVLLCGAGFAPVLYMDGAAFDGVGRFHQRFAEGGVGVDVTGDFLGR